MASKKGSIGIIGLGKFGLSLVKELKDSGKSLICIDKDENKVKKVLDIADEAFVSEEISVKTLEDTGFKECDTIVVCIGEHLDTAIFATLNALNLGVNKVIAISNTEEQGIVLEKLGAEVIYPYKDSANRLAKKILNNNFLDFISLSDDVEIIEVKIPKSYIGKSILEIDIRKKYGINIIAIETSGRIITRIEPTYKLTKEDALVVIGEKTQIQKFEKRI